MPALKCLAVEHAVSSIVALSILTDRWMPFPEMLLLCNEAANRQAKKNSIKKKSEADGVQSKPLGLEYIADRYMPAFPQHLPVVKHACAANEEERSHEKTNARMAKPEGLINFCGREIAGSTPTTLFSATWSDLKGKAGCRASSR